jgi:hypothetical protein
VTYEGNHFLEQRKRIVTITPTLIDNKTTKVIRLREDRFYVFFSFLSSSFCFVMGSFFMYFRQA